MSNARTSIALTIALSLPALAFGFDHHRGHARGCGVPVCGAPCIAVEYYGGCGASTAGWWSTPPAAAAAGPVRDPGGETPRQSNAELVKLLSVSFADVAALRTVVVTAAYVNGSTVQLEGTLVAESQRELVRSTGETALRGYIQRGLLPSLNNVNPVLDVTRMTVTAAASAPRRTQVQAGLDPQAIAAAARELRLGKSEKFAVALQRGSSVVDEDSRDVAEAYYGEGFHAYWNRDLVAARSHFQTAVNHCNDDARFWYYKGLTEHRLGDNAAATISLAHAVRLHRDSKSPSSIFKSLERVQGDLRQRLDTARQLLPSEKAAALVAARR